ncbi:hypothetical protein QP150_04320 [Sphingomonas sp. 22L2VL55-3]
MTTLLFLPAGETGYRWMRVADARVVGEGRVSPMRSTTRRSRSRPPMR